LLHFHAEHPLSTPLDTMTNVYGRAGSGVSAPGDIGKLWV